MLEVRTSAQQARERIARLARSIEELSATTLPPKQFFQIFLERVIEALGARAGAVWMVENGQLQLTADVDVAETGYFSHPPAQQFNHRLIGEVAADGQARAMPSDDSDADLVNRYLLLIAALHANGANAGVVEIFQRPDIPPQARAGNLQFVEQMCGFASKYLEQQNQPQPETLSESQAKIEQFLLRLHRGLELKQVAATAANEGRLLLNCDRVSIVLKRGRKVAVTAISGQDIVNPRANLTKAMVALASRVIAAGEPLRYTGKQVELAPQIEIPLTEFLQESNSRMVLVVPLREPPPIQTEEEENQPKRDRKPRKVFGCLVIEQFTDSEPRHEVTEYGDLLTRHAAAALHNGLTYQSLFLLPVWRQLGKLQEWTRGRKLVKTLGVLAAIAVVGSILAFVPWDFRVQGKGRLMPVVQSDVFAPLDGDVYELFVTDGQHVKQGDPLLRLRNNDLERDLLTTRNDLHEKQQLVFALDAEKTQAQLKADRAEEIRLSGRIAETNSAIRGLQEKLKVLEERAAQLHVRAPIDGVVATFQVEQNLRNRPVRRGEVLLQVMDETGPWHLELEVPEHRMGHLLRGQKKLDTAHLPIEFLLVTSPELTWDGQLQDIATRAVNTEESESVVEVMADIAPDAVPDRRIGAEVRAKINCGPRSLGYVLFGDVVEFVQKYFWL